MVNCAVEDAPHSEAAREKVEAFFSRLGRAFCGQLRIATQRGQIRPRRCVADVAMFLTTLAQGINVSTKVHPGPRRAARAVSVALAQLS